MATVISEILVRIGAELSGFQKGMETTAKSLEAMGKKFSDVGRTLSAGITLPLLGVGAAAIKMSTDFNAAMADVATLIPRSTDLVVRMKKELQDLAIATGKSTTDLARGLYQTISAGVDAEKAMSVLNVAARAAAAGLTDTNTAVDAITSTLNAYGLSAEHASRVSDILLTTVRLGKTTFGELAATIGRVIPIAAQTGVSFEDLNAAIVATTAVGLGTAEAITGIRAALNNILKPSKEASELAASLGLQFNAQALKAKGLIPMLQEIVKATKGDTDAMTALFGSVEGVNAVLALTSEQGMQKLLAAQEEMRRSVGATDLAFQVQTRGVNAAGFALARLQQKIAVIAQNFGDALAPSLSRVLDAAQPLLNAVKGLVDWFANLNPELQTAIIAVVGLAAAMGPVALAIGGAMQLFSGLSAAARLLSGAFTFLLGPAGLVVAAIAAVVAIGVVLYRNWDQISAWLTATWGRILDAALSVWNSVAGFLSGVWEHIRQVAATVWNAIRDFFAEWWETLLAVFGGPLGLLVLLIVKKWDEISTFTTRVWQAISGFLSSVWQAISNTAQTVWNAIAGFLSQKWADIKASVTTAFTAIRDFLSSIWQYIKQMFWNAFGDMIRDALDFGKRIMESLKRGIASIRLPVPRFSLSWREGPLGIKIPDLDIGVRWTALGDILHLAEGGILLKPTLAVLAERGPEAVVPLDRAAPMLPGPVTIIVDFDGRTIARAVLPHMHREIVLKAGLA